jgi:outer membrane protein assembly factor BamB
MHRILLGSLLSLVIVGSLVGGDWTGFRGPDGSAVSSEKGLPVKWSETEGLRWKVALPGRGLSNPVIAGGRVYVTACSTYRERRLHVLAFDAATGKQLWERQLAATGGTACHPKTNMAGPTPVTDGQSIYALFATGDLVALDRDGNLLWYRSLVSDYPNISNQVGMAASPVLVGDTLVVPMDTAADAFLAGLDRKTGENRWKVERERCINWVTPLVVKDGKRTSVVFNNASEVTAYDADTGKVRWTYATENASTIPSSATGDGMVFVPGRSFTALRPKGDMTPEVVWRTQKMPLGYTSPIHHEGKVYGLTSIGVTCLDAVKGEVIFQARMRGPFAASPVIADGKLYAVNEAGLTTVLKLGQRPEILGVNDLQDTILATPAVADGAIYLRSDRWLYCIGGKK